MWIATTKYYIEYFAAYAFLMRIGIKCEIHDCTIELLRIFEGLNLLNTGTAEMLEKDKALRIDNQYYLKNRPVDVDLEKLRTFVLDMRSRIENLTEKDIERARSVVD